MANNPTDIRRDLALLAESTERIDALAVVGSRVGGGGDVAADLDLVVVSSQAEELSGSLAWLAPLGRVWVWADTWSHGIPVKQVLLDRGMAVDLVILPHPWPTLASRAQRLAAATLARGYELIKDTVGLAAQLEALAAQAPGPRPSQEEFADTVASFFLASVQAVKRLGRGEVYSAKQLVDCRLKALLVRVLGWQVRSSRGEEVDAYWGGRHIEQWADARTLEALGTTFATYQAESIRHALFATMDSFRLAAIETAQRWSLEYPEVADRKATVWAKTWM